MQTFDEEENVQTTPSRDDLYQLVQSYRALYFDFYYITDELVWYGVRGNAVRHSLALADLAYGVVFNHEVFRSFVGGARTGSDPVDVVAFLRLLLPWIRQLGHLYASQRQKVVIESVEHHDSCLRSAAFSTPHRRLDEAHSKERMRAGEKHLPISETPETSPKDLRRCHGPLQEPQPLHIKISVVEVREGV